MKSQQKDKNILILLKVNHLALMISKTYTLQLKLNKERSTISVLTLEIKPVIFLITWRQEDHLVLLHNDQAKEVFRLDRKNNL